MSKRAELRDKRRREKQRQRWILALISAGVILIVTAIILLPSLQPVGAFAIPETIERPMVEGNAMGDPNAPVVIEEFSDFRCFYCGRFAQETEPALIESYIASGQVRFIYRQFPLGPASVPAAEASYCAAEQEAFWPYHDILFANQDETDPNAYSDKRLVAFAEAVGLDSESFERCISERRYKDQVQADYAAGIEAGVESTPTFFVNGNPILGAQPLSVFEERIEAALQAAGQ